MKGDDGVEIGAGAAKLENGAAPEAEADGGSLFVVEGSFLFKEGVESQLGAGTHE